MAARQYRPCPACGMSSYVRKDGTLGTHYAHTGRVRRTCPEGASDGRPVTAAGRRVVVTVTFAAEIPRNWSLDAQRTKLRTLLMDWTSGAHLLDIDVREDEDG